MAMKKDSKGMQFKPVHFEWDWKTIALYNMGIGAYELEYNFENALKVFPSFAVIPYVDSITFVIEDLQLNYLNMLHSGQRIEIVNPDIPIEAKVVTESKVAEVWDTGKAAIVVLESTTKTLDGDTLFINQYSLLMRGEGGYGGPKGPAARHTPPDREPDVIVKDTTYPIQHLMYRLSGDLNPVHIDPDFARQAGFPKPILHGLCTFGFVCRAAVKGCLNNDPKRLKSFEVRFTNVVFPGEEIITKLWDVGDKIILTAETGDGRIVLSNAAMEIWK